MLNLVLSLRHFAFDRKILHSSPWRNGKTIVVGNLEFGGSGKTPHTLFFSNTSQPIIPSFSPAVTVEKAADSNSLPPIPPRPKLELSRKSSPTDSMNPFAVAFVKTDSSDWRSCMKNIPIRRLPCSMMLFNTENYNPAFLRCLPHFPSHFGRTKSFLKEVCAISQNEQNRPPSSLSPVLRKTLTPRNFFKMLHQN